MYRCVCINIITIIAAYCMPDSLHPQRPFTTHSAGIKGAYSSGDEAAAYYAHYSTSIII